MIGFLRSLGVLNAAVWLGAVVFYTFGAVPGLTSTGARELLGERNYGYFSVAMADLVSTRIFHLQLICAVLAVLHLMAEWLYLGKVPQKLWRGLLAGLVGALLLNGVVLQPMLRKLHGIRYSPHATLEQRDAAARSYRTWNAVYKGVNLLALAGLGCFFWRVANPPDPARFASAVKFRS